MLDKYIKKEVSLANYHFNRLTVHEQKLVNDKLELWKRSRDEESTDLDSDPNFGISYVKSFYRDRVNCFYHLLKDVAKHAEIREILENSTEILSFCCGSGPEIAAYICFVRNFLQLPHLQLNITGFDKYDHWRLFVEALGPLDDLSHIEFKSSIITVQFIRNLHNDKHQVCIMLYPQAVQFDRNIWRLLRRKFRFILVLDQDKHEFHNTIIKYGFEIDNFQFSGTKMYFYWINESQKVLTNSPNNHCGRNHEYTNKCFNNVRYTFDCGHETTLKCHSFGDDITTKKCEQIVTFTRNCGHEFDIECCLKDLKPDKCDEIITVNHSNCYHSFKVKCSDNTENRICNEDVEHEFDCGHRIVIKCGSYNDEVRTRKCEEFVTVTKTCGHKFNIKCRLKEQGSRKRCEQLVDLHHTNCSDVCMMECYKKNDKPVCNKTLIFRYDCGHERSFTCHKHNEEITSNLCGYCDNISFESGSSYCVTRKLCGHKMYCTLPSKDVRNLFKYEIENECSEICGRILPLCHHKCRQKCGNCYNRSLHGKCLERCHSKLECGHFCRLYCHTGIYSIHRCSANCDTDSTHNWFQPFTLDLTMKSKWNCILDNCIIDDASLRRHIEIIVEQMTKFRKLIVTKMISDQIYELLCQLLRIYSEMCSGGQEHCLLFRCKKLILFIDVQKPYRLKFNLLFIKAQTQNLSMMLTYSPEYIVEALVNCQTKY